MQKKHQLHFRTGRYDIDTELLFNTLLILKSWLEVLKGKDY